MYDPALQLDRAVQDVFAAMLHLACTSASGEAVAFEAALCSTVSFSGSLVGCCTLAMDPAAAAELGAILLGIPSGLVSEELCADTAGELCNMIAGSWKGAQSSDLDHCYLSCPVPHRADPSLFRHTIARLYRFSGNPLLLTLCFNA